MIVDLQKVMEELSDLLDARDKALTGRLCEQVEILTRNGDFSEASHKDLIKTVVYSEGRFLRKILRRFFVPSLSFKL